jgi:hypothetical protein
MQTTIIKNKKEGEYKLLSEITSGLLIVLILISGFFAYLILFEIQDINSPSLTLNKAQYQITADFNKDVFEESMEEDFLNTVETQNKWIEKQREINDQYDEKLENVVNSQDSVFTDEYYNEIEKRQRELDKEYQQFVENINFDTENMIKYYSSMVNYELEESLENIRLEYDEELKEFEQEVRKENRNELLNLRIKLLVLELSEQRRKEFQDRIEEIQNSKSIKISNKISEIYYRLRIASNELSEARDKKVASLSEILNNDKKVKINNKKESLDRIYKDYQEIRYAALSQQMTDFEKTISNDKDELFEKRNNIIKIVTSDLNTLHKIYLLPTEERN